MFSKWRNYDYNLFRCSRVLLLNLRRLYGETTGSKYFNLIKLYKLRNLIFSRDKFRS